MNDGMINYDELYKIVWNKYKATHDELHYWISSSHRNCFMGNYDEICLKPYLSDIPSDIRYWPIPDKDFNFPQDRFYNLDQANNFKPHPTARFVYLRDLTKRDNWYIENIDRNLKRANEIGILRFYDKHKNEFTLHKTWEHKSTYNSIHKDWCNKELWCNSVDISSLTSNPETFFLIYDILTIERVFFNRDKESCLDELYGKDRKKTHDD